MEILSTGNSYHIMLEGPPPQIIIISGGGGVFNSFIEDSLHTIKFVQWKCM